ncbi:hypothetical protein [Tateyamaria sp. SN6-1]|uniref:hypothetical protein n=1 Tax=Tateyamaria sp. SN6-1 TaxID=3092148 RepID=UPI0039F511A5
MYFTLFIIAIFWIAMWFATRKLRSFVGGMHAPRDIREEESLTKRIAMAGYGVLSPVGNPQDNLATIFKFGRKDARTEGSAAVFQSTAGWRYGFLLVLPLLAWFTVYIESQTDVGGQTPYSFYALVAAGLLYTGVYIWRFRLVIDGIDMTCTNTFLMTRHFDLTKLIRARTKQDGYTLYFEDGRKIAVPRFIEGHDLLRDFLIGQLEDNGY